VTQESVGSWQLAVKKGLPMQRGYARRAFADFCQLTASWQLAVKKRLPMQRGYARRAFADFCQLTPDL
jgi:hypothetical protein